MANGVIGTIANGWQYVDTGDFDGDGIDDILFRETATGHLGAWDMGPGGAEGWFDMGVVNTDWFVPKTESGDFNGDGTSDILWQNSFTGALGIWLMGDGQPSGWADLGVRPNDWIVQGFGDFNADGTDDVLWFKFGARQTGAWLMADGQPTGWLDLGILPANQFILNTGDVNGDGTDDVVTQTSVLPFTIGAILVRDGLKLGTAVIGDVASGFDSGKIGDLDGSGGDDAIFTNSSNSLAGAWQLTANGNAATPSSWLPLPGFGNDFTLTSVGQFDGQGHDDLLWFHGPTRQLFINDIV